jgi:diacylglycerol O-acyltransferase
MQPLLAFGLLAVAGLLIKPAQDAMLNLFGKKTTAVMTNVPGPREKLKFLGATLEQSMFWVPQSGDRRPGRVDPELWRRRAVWRDHRHHAVP